jgi:hypothetical protein
VQDVHLRASTWFEEAGDIDRAVRHAVAVRDFDRAERLVVEHSPWYYTNSHFTTVRSWVDLFPRDRVAKSPALCLCGAPRNNRPRRCRRTLRLAPARRTRSRLGAGKRRDLPVVSTESALDIECRTRSAGPRGRCRSLPGTSARDLACSLVPVLRSLVVVGW